MQDDVHVENTAESAAPEMDAAGDQEQVTSDTAAEEAAAEKPEAGIPETAGEENASAEADSEAPEAESEKAAESEAEKAAESEAEDVTETEPVTEAAESEPAAELPAEEIQEEAEPETPATDAQEEPETEAETGPETEAETGPETEAETGPETEAEPEPETEPEKATETDAAADEPEKAAGDEPEKAAADIPEKPADPGKKEKKAAPDHSGKKANREKKDKKQERKSLYDRKKPDKKHGRKDGRKDEKKQKQHTLKIRDLVLGEGMPAICVPLTGETEEELLQQAARAVCVQPDLVEWRADYFHALQDEEAAAAALGAIRKAVGNLPVLFTVRTGQEGGELPFDAEEYEKLIRWGIGQEETDLVDIEILHYETDPSELTELAHLHGKTVVASAHFFAYTPGKEELRQLFYREGQTGADILKVAAMPEKPKDVLRLMQATRQIREETGKILITMSMGEMGKVSRVSGALTGSAVTFGTAGWPSAPGQISADVLREILQEL